MTRALRPLAWPRAETPSGPPHETTAPPPPAISGWFDAASFIGRFGPEVSRAIGARLSLRRVAGPEAGEAVPLIAIGGAALGGRALSVELDRATIAVLLERMFGAPSPSPHDLLAGLSPASGSWKGLAHLLGEALVSALAGSGGTPSRFAPARRIEAAASAPGAGRIWFALDFAGAAGWLALSGEEPVAVEAASPDPAEPAPAPRRAVPAGGPPLAAAGPAWRTRAGALARQLDVTVGARIAEIRVPLATLLSLKVGAVLPIERPRLLMLTVDGAPFRPLETPEMHP
jgi:hypothetical protein